MNRIFLFVLSFLTAGVLSAASPMPVTAGLPPVAYIISQVGGSRVKVSSILPEGRSPHDYAPGPKDIRAAAAGKIFFTTGMAHEQRLLKVLPLTTRIADLSAGIRRIPLSSGEGHHHHHHDGGHHHSDGMDPHIWLSPVNAAAMASAVEQALSSADPAGAAFYRQNAEKFSNEMFSLHKELKKRLAPFRGRTFFVYHPAFGYFARAYGLKQEAIELDGREASPARLAKIIRQAREDKVSVIFVQKQFNPASAKALAAAIRGKIAELDPLAGDLSASFRTLGKTLVQGFLTGK